MMSIRPISILRLLLLILMGMEIMRQVLLVLLLQLWLMLPIVRHWLHLRHLVVRLGEELAVGLVLLIAHVCHRMPIPILLLLLVALLKRRYLRKAIIYWPVGLRAPVVVVHCGDMGCRGSPPLTLPDSCKEAPAVFPIDCNLNSVFIWFSKPSLCCYSRAWPGW